MILSNPYGNIAINVNTISIIIANRIWFLCNTSANTATKILCGSQSGSSIEKDVEYEAADDYVILLNEKILSMLCQLHHQHQQQ